MRSDDEEVQSSHSLAKQFSYNFRVTRYRMKGEWEAQTENGADKESAEDHFLFPVDLPWRADQEVSCSTDEHDAPKQVRPEKKKKSEHCVAITFSSSALTKCFRFPCEVWRSIWSKRWKSRAVGDVPCEGNRCLAAILGDSWSEQPSSLPPKPCGRRLPPARQRCEQERPSLFRQRGLPPWGLRSSNRGDYEIM